MSYLNPMLMPGMAQSEQFARRPFLNRAVQTGGNDPAYPQPGMQTGGALPPQGYDASGINPHGMYTGGTLPPQQQAGMPMGGNLPPMRLAQLGGAPSPVPPYANQLARAGLPPGIPGGYGPRPSMDPMGLFGSSASDRGHYADGRAIPIGDGAQFTARRMTRGLPDYGDRAYR